MKKYIWFVILVLFCITVRAEDDRYDIEYTTSQNQSISFSTWWIVTQYYNKDANSDVIWNYLWWSYYSTIYGYFQFLNVYFSQSTSACGTWYGYKLSGRAFNAQVWEIIFDYDKDTFVYYCMKDNKLYGTAYIPALWQQNFNGIQFKLFSAEGNIWTPQGDTLFVNNTTMIFMSNMDNLSLKHWEEAIFYIWKPKQNP